MAKEVIVSVINDLYSDQRVHKVCTSLESAGFKPLLVGRRFSNSPPLNRTYDTYRFKFLINKGPLFYLFFNIRLFFYLMLKRSDFLLANDLDTLLANFLVSKIKGSTLVYDSHELFTEVPELVNRPFVRSVWLRIEKWILPKLKRAYTVGPSIKDYYNKRYGIKMGVIFNFPFTSENHIKKEEKGSIKVLIYQGALNVSRGLEELIEAMQFLEGFILKLFGSGDIEDALKLKVKNLKLEDKVIFYGRVAPSELRDHTRSSSIGVSIEKTDGLSYSLALPNKVFDYLMAGIPVYRSELTEIDGLFGSTEVGIVLKSYNPEDIADDLLKMSLSKDYKRWSENAILLSSKYNWESQEKELLKYFE